MILFEKSAELSEYLKNKQRAGETVGFVPTMGALHRGHLSLVERSNGAKHLTVCSVFVNPRQFDDQGDLENYPRDSENDIRLISEVENPSTNSTISTLPPISSTTSAPTISSLL